jgi:branched-chain amino acid transport system substrate-binding protein
MRTRQILDVLLASAVIASAGIGHAHAAEPRKAQSGALPLKVALVVPLTGPKAAAGKQIVGAIKLFMMQNGSPVPGRKIELLVRDDGGVAESSRSIAQQLVSVDKVDVIAGFVSTPQALAAAPVATQGKTPMLVIGADGPAIPEQSPYIVRTGAGQAQVATAIAYWATRHGVHKVMTFVGEGAADLDAEKLFKAQYVRPGSQVLAEIHAPSKNPDFAALLAKVADVKPDAVFVSLPPEQAAPFLKQFSGQGLDRSGIRVLATGELTDDDRLNAFGDAAVGVLTAGPYSAAHSSELNRKFVAGFEAGNKFRPNLLAVAGYDAIRLVYNAMAATKGRPGGEALVAAMKGQEIESPRGFIRIDAQTRDVVQDMYIRRVERMAASGNQLYNVEIETQKAPSLPAKAK